ncbi:MAG: LysM peptidoglycan-binding domain-containing protein [bacterium]
MKGFKILIFIIVFIGCGFLFPVIKFPLKKEKFLIGEKKYLLIATVIKEHNIDIQHRSEKSKEKILKNTIYKVRLGDTLWSISRKFGLNVSTIISVNNIASNIIREGMEIKIPSQNGILYKIKSKDTLLKIARIYNVSLEKIIEANGLANTTIREGKTIFLPCAKLPEKPQIFCANKNHQSKPSLVFSKEDIGNCEIVKIACSFLNIPYKYGGMSNNGIDCSGFVKIVFGQLGVSLPRTASSQFKEGSSVKELQPGDLLFFARKGDIPSHVGIYMGEGRFIHASSGREKKVITTELNKYTQRFIGAKRIFYENL